MSTSIAIITGASSGVGREFAHQLDSDPEIDEFWLCARREERLQELARELTTPSRILAGSVTDDAWLRSLRAALAKEEVRVKVLVNSAGFGMNKRFMDIPEDVNADMVEVNCEALTRLCQIAIPAMGEGSRILNIASVASFLPQPNFAAYAATKAYVTHFSRALHAELKGKKITVCSVCPNPMETEFFEVAGNRMSPLKKIGMEPVEGVVRKALRRSARGKDLSVYSPVAQGVRLISRILPHRFILFMERVLGLIP